MQDSQQWHAVKSIELLPSIPCVYVIWNGPDCLYVGESKNLGKRITSKHPWYVAKDLYEDPVIAYTPSYYDLTSRRKHEMDICAELRPMWNWGGTPKLPGKKREKNKLQETGNERGSLIINRSLSLKASAILALVDAFDLDSFDSDLLTKALKVDPMEIEKVLKELEAKKYIQR